MVAEDLVLTVAEVNDRLPLVRSIVRDIVELHQTSQASGAFRSVRQTAFRVTGDDESSMNRKCGSSKTNWLTTRVGSMNTPELQRIGGTVTDPVTGIVDFPAILSGDRVWLCWQMGEPEVRFWHAGECGESERLPLEQDEFRTGVRQSVVVIHKHRNDGLDLGS